MSSPVKIGIALGGGSARGWAHLGILQWLQENGIQPDIICGTSIGALVGGAEAAGQVDRLRDWVLKLEWQDVLSYIDVSFSGGLIRGTKLFDFFQSHWSDYNIEDLDRSFASVATDLASGQEVWLREGSLLKAIRASVAVPGIIAPDRHEATGRWLVDGGLVNPVPVSLCRALGAERVIAVDLNTDLLQRFGKLDKQSEDRSEFGAFSERDWKSSISSALRERAQQLKEYFAPGKGSPSLVDVVTQSVYIMQVRITRARVAGDPPDILLTPKLGDIHFMEFHRAQESIDAGYHCAEEAESTIQDLVEK